MIGFDFSVSFLTVILFDCNINIKVNAYMQIVPDVLTLAL